MKSLTVLAGALLLLGVSIADAQAACPSPTIVTVPNGQTVHVTPVDQNCAPIAVSLCQLLNLAPAVATFVYDSTGANLTGVAATSTGATSPASWSCSSSGVTKSYSFTVSVPAVWSVTAIGLTSP